MFVITVAYPVSSGSRFDLDYYLQTHIPLVHQRWDSLGLKSLDLYRGTGTPDGGEAPVVMLALLTWPSRDAFEAAAKQHGEEVFGDIPNFTDMKAQVQFNEPAS